MGKDEGKRAGRIDGRRWQIVGSELSRVSNSVAQCREN